MVLLDLGVTGRKKKRLTGRAHMSAREERESATAGMHKPEEKVPFGECAKASRANWTKQGRRQPEGWWTDVVKLGRI
jgi:hypothetical protein